MSQSSHERLGQLNHPTTTGLVYHDEFLRHDTGPAHPERPDRLRSLATYLKEFGLWNQLQLLLFGQASEEWLTKVHTPRHITIINDTCARGGGILDQGDTVVCSDSHRIATLAAGGVLSAIDAVMGGTLRNVFCAIRPPGHHAESATPMGFCLYNNVAIGARYAQTKYGVGKVAIIDWDVHHGNGTQEIFYQDPSVFYISLHQYPFYPGTGARNETGTGKGEGYTLNTPMRSGSGEMEYMHAFREDILPRLRLYRPELILLSAGFDAHRDDPLANINLTESTFSEMTRMMMDVADTSCDGRIVSVLEGGYNLRALSRSVEAHLKELVKVAG